MGGKPTDQQILDAIAKHRRHGEMTYVVRNILAMDFGLWRDIAVECWATSQVDDGDVF